MVSCSEDVGFAADCGLRCVSFQKIGTKRDEILPPTREDVTALLLYF